MAGESAAFCVSAEHFRGYRNYFVAGADNVASMERLRAAGLVVKNERYGLSSDPCYHATIEGAHAIGQILWRARCAARREWVPRWPMAATWLRGKRWLDEVPRVAQSEPLPVFTKREQASTPAPTRAPVRKPYPVGNEMTETQRADLLGADAGHLYAGGWKDFVTDYPRLQHYWRSHARRFAAYVEAHGLPCQDCGGMGGETEVILDDGTGPRETCGFCEGTGRTTRHLRGVWLRWKQTEARQARHG